MKRIFITGSSDGLGLAAARALAGEGHEVVLHARSPQRAQALRTSMPKHLGLVIGDLSSASETRAIADQVNGIGRMDAVIHNAGVYQLPERGNTPEGHASLLAINTLAPYMLTALLERPDRLIYLSSGLHRAARTPLRDVEWREHRWDTDEAYAQSKLYLTAFAFALAQRWPKVLSNAVDPGWVPTKMGGPGAPGDLVKGHLTQTWLAVSEEPAAKVSGAYWHHRQQQPAAAEASDPAFQERVLTMLEELTGVSLD